MKNKPCFRPLRAISAHWSGVMKRSRRVCSASRLNTERSPGSSGLSSSAWNVAARRSVSTGPGSSMLTVTDVSRSS